MIRPALQNEPGRRWLDGVSFALLLTAALGGAFCLGATATWAEGPMQLLVAAATICWLLASPRLSTLLLASPAAALGLCAVQLVPLPEAMLAWIAPLKHEAIRSAEPLIGSPWPETAAARPDATVETARRWVLLGFAVAVAADVSRRRPAWRPIATVAIGAAATAMLVSAFVGPDEPGRAMFVFNMDEPWLSPYHGSGIGRLRTLEVAGLRYVQDRPLAGRPLGAMANANHYAAFLGLSAPFALAALAGLRARRRWLRALRGLAIVAWAGLALFAVAGLAESWGGTLGLLLAGPLAAVAVLCPPEHRRKASVGTALAILAGGAALAIGADPIGQLGGRVNAWWQALRVFAANPALGLGAGNYPELARRGLGAAPEVPSIVLHLPHNVYAQYLAETGALGAAAAGLLAAFLWRRRRAAGAASGSPGFRWACAASLLYAAIHGLADHSVQIPANALLSAVVLGLVLAPVIGAERAEASRPARGGRWLRAGAIIVLAAVLFGTVQHGRARLLAAPLERAAATMRTAEGTERRAAAEQLRSALPRARRAFHVDGGSAAIARSLAAAHLRLARGGDRDHLVAAERWLRSAVERCPIDRWSVRTLRGLRERLRTGEPR